MLLLTHDIFVPMPSLSNIYNNTFSNYMHMSFCCTINTLLFIGHLKHRNLMIKFENDSDITIEDR